jgi:hypothetical protein
MLRSAKSQRCGFDFMKFLECGFDGRVVKFGFHRDVVERGSEFVLFQFDVSQNGSEEMIALGSNGSGRGFG